MKTFTILLYMFTMLSSIKAQDFANNSLEVNKLDEEQIQNIIKEFEPFFKESFAQQMESFKLKKDFITGLSYIDFCEYPPDRSHASGALNNGRFRGEKINDLPFACDKSSGARKYFIHNKNINQIFFSLKKLKFLDFLTKNLPVNNEIVKNNQETIITFWKQINSKDIDFKQLWILYRNETIERSCTIIFTQKDKYTDVVLQYLNYN